MGKAKLTPDQVAEIRRQYPSRSLSELGKVYGVSKQAVWRWVQWARKGSSTHNLK